MAKSFTWGHVLARFEYDFDGRTMEVTKYHPWRQDGCTLLTGNPNESVISGHDGDCAKKKTVFPQIKRLWCH